MLRERGPHKICVNRNIKPTGLSPKPTGVVLARPDTALDEHSPNEMFRRSIAEVLIRTRLS